MKKILITTLVLFFFLPLITTAQQWSNEQQEIINTTIDHYNLWDKAFQQKNLDLWFNESDLTATHKKYIAWFTQEDDMPIRWEGQKRSVEKTLWPGSKNNYWEDFRPIAVEVFNNVGIIFFYDYWVNESNTGEIVREERKGMWTFIKMNGKWTYVAGMTAY